MELQDSSSRVTLSDSEGSEILSPSVEGLRMTICSISLEALLVITHSAMGKARGTLPFGFT